MMNTRNDIHTLLNSTSNEHAGPLRPFDYRWISLLSRSLAVGVIWLVVSWAGGSGRAAVRVSGPQHTAEPPPSPTTDAAQPTEQMKRRRDALILYTKAFEAARHRRMFQALDLLRQVIELDPTAPEPHVTLGEFQYSMRNITQAKQEAEAALALDPHHPGAHKLLGRIYRDEALVSGDADKARQAIEEFRQVIDRDDSDIEAWQSLAELYELTDQKEKSIQALTRWTSLDPTAERAFYALAQYYFSEGKYRQAGENAARALSIRPLPTYAIILARSLMAQGQTVDALRIYRQARNRHPNDTELEVRYAEALIYAGQYDEAIHILQRERQANPGNVEIIRLLAQAYRRSGRREEAVQTLVNALQDVEVSESLGLQWVLAQIYEEMGQTDKAVATYESILDVVLNPDGSVSKSYAKAAEDVLTSIGLAYRRAGRRQEAIAAFQRMRKVLGPKNPQPDLLIVDTLMEEEKYKAALDYARRAADRYPENRRFRLLEAQALSRLGRVDEAVAVLDGLLTNSIEDIEVLSTKAMVLMDAGRYEEAKQALEEGLRRDPRNNGLLIQLSIVQEKLEQPEKAEATLRAILERDPDNPVALNNLGYYLAERGERLEEALELTQRAVNIVPTEGSFLDSLGWVYFQMGQLDEAERYLERALNAKPNDATIQEHMGDLYLRRGQLDLARRAFERALKFAREKEERARIEAKLKKLTKPSK
ncbi:MAG: tetratricopeptide repeat protein [Acidobacteria bacterium]|nr:MAG: tetratricopeptide repeat protein [Acidobacteriota bacterium]